MSMFLGGEQALVCLCSIKQSNATTAHLLFYLISYPGFTYSSMLTRCKLTCRAYQQCGCFMGMLISRSTGQTLDLTSILVPGPHMVTHDHGW